MTGKRNNKPPKDLKPATIGIIVIAMIPIVQRTIFSKANSMTVNIIAKGAVQQAGDTAIFLKKPLNLWIIQSMFKFSTVRTMTQ